MSAKTIEVMRRRGGEGVNQALASRLVGALVRLVGAFMCLSGCVGEGEGDALVIPPGDQVLFKTDGFLQYSDDQYEMLLRQVGDTNAELKTVLDITPAGAKLLDGDSVHSVIVPKGMHLSGMFVAQVSMTYHALTLSAFVLDDGPVRPSITTTLVYDVIAAYPGQGIKKLKFRDLRDLQNYVESFARERMQMFGLRPEMDPMILYRFLKNGLSNNIEFLERLASMGFPFAYGSDGEVETDPYPFGEPNNPPVLRPSSSTPEGTVSGIENSLLEIKVESEDPDGDLLFYAWRQNGEIVLKDVQSFFWLPTFFDGRPEPYPLDVIITDGGRVLEAGWEILIQDLNRKPKISGVCSLDAVEAVEWLCKLTAEDLDLDALEWTLIDSGLSAKARINGAASPGEVTGNEIEIRWTPDNEDARRGNGYIEVRVSDGKLGLDIRSFPLLVADSNGAPVWVGALTPTNSQHTTPHEWDFCLAADPDGVGAFTFELRFQDPDNLPTANPRANPPDQISVGLSGSLASDVIAGSLVQNGDQSLLPLEWRPTHSNKTGTLVLQISDDHGAMSPLVTLNLSAEDRNETPCLTVTSPINLSVSDAAPQMKATVAASEPDQDVPVLESFGIPWTVVPFLHECDTTSLAGVSLHQTFQQASPVYRTSNYNRDQCVEGRIKSSYSGVVIFQRSAAHTEDIAIPQGFDVFTNDADSGVRLRFETAAPAVLYKNDRLVSVPIKAINRTAPAGSLTVLGGSLSDPTVTVTNPSSLTGNGNLVFSRPSGGAAVTIPAGFKVRSNLGAGHDTFEYEIATGATLGSGQTSLTVPAQRSRLQAGIGQITQLESALPGPVVTVSNPIVAQDRVGYEVYGYKSTGSINGVDQFCWNVSAIDHEPAPANSVTRMAGTLSDPSVQVRNPLSISGGGGWVEFYRASAGSAVSVPSGFIVENLSGTRFQTVAAASLAAGATSTQVEVSRVEVRSPASRPVCLGMSDYNYSSQFISPTAASVIEGSNLGGLLVEVSDNPSDPLSPRDPDDRYVFTMSPSGTAPTGTFMACRAPADDPADITAPACNPCSSAAGLNHAQSARCYLRYAPSATDVATTFNFQFQVNDQGAATPANSNIRYGTISVQVQERNDPPYFTDNGWNALSEGATVNEAVPLGTFVEGTAGAFSFYVFDPDKGYYYKMVGLSIHNEVYDVATGTWMPKPSGLSVGVASFKARSSGFGGETTGRLTWTPTDQDAKNFSSDEGFVVRITAYDSTNDASVRKSAVGHYLVKVQNRNNAPEVEAIGANSSFRLSANTYFQTEFWVRDIDAYTPYGGTFATDLTLCRDGAGDPALHPDLDAPSGAPVDCHAVTPAWPVELTEYDPLYIGNKDVGATPCRSGSGEDALMEDLAVPKLTRISGPSLSGGARRYKYRLEWCPQESHLGEHAATLQITDNGDVARNGATEVVLAGSAPLQLQVVAPVFFESPRLDPGGQPQHFMKQASGGLTNSPFRYQTVVNNSLGNPLNYSVIAAPRSCASENGVCIDGSGLLTWVPRLPDDLTDPDDPSTWHRIELRVTDTVTGDYDQVHFYLQVQDPVSPLEYPPTITGAVPAGGTATGREKEFIDFSVAASDPNSDDQLHYRWYVDGVLKFDEGPDFSWRPGVGDGSLDPDGSGSLRRGEHHIRVEVTDGNSFVAQEWIATVRNTLLVPEQVFDLYQARTQTNPPATVTNLNWLHETIAPTAFSGNRVDYLLFTGNYKKGGVLKHFVWSLQFLNGAITTPNGSLAKPPWNFFEDLPWPSGRQSQRIAYHFTSSGVFDISITSQFGRMGPYSATTDSVRMSGDISALTLNNSNKCTGTTCAQNLYTTGGSYGARVTAPYVSGAAHLFYASDDGKSLFWDRNASGAQNVRSFAPNTITGMAVNGARQRLYVSTQDQVTKTYQVHVFNVAPVKNSPPQKPTYLTSLTLYDGVPDHVDSMPTDIAVDTVRNAAYVLLSGTGGVARLLDDSGTPTSANLSYIGVNQINSSATDQPSRGAKLAFDPVSDLMVGLSRSGRQVFTIDPVTYDVFTYATEVGFDSVVVVPESNLTLLVNRLSGKVYRTK